MKLALFGHSIYSHCQVLVNLGHEQLSQQECQGNLGDLQHLGESKLNSKTKVGVGSTDQAERQLGAEKNQGVIFRAWAVADHPGVTKGREEEGWRSSGTRLISKPEPLSSLEPGKQ